MILTAPPTLALPRPGRQQGEDENFAIAHNYCLYHTRHHSFPDTDPYKVNDAVDALRERLGIHAQLEKQEALDALLGRFGQTPWPADVPDVHSRVLLLLLSLSRNPLRTKYTHIDAAVALGEGALDAPVSTDDDASVDDDGGFMRVLRGRGAGRSGTDDDDDDDDDASASTLSDWTDDEAEQRSRRAVGIDHAAARDAAARSASTSSEKDAAGAGDDPGFSWSTLGGGHPHGEWEPSPGAGANFEEDEWAWDDGGASRGGAGVRGAGSTVVAAAARLLPALASSRGGEGATLIAAAAAYPHPSGGNHGEERGKEARQTEAKVVGAAIHALQGDAPPRYRPSAVPHLSPTSLAAALERANEAAAFLEEVGRAAAAVLDVPAHTPVGSSCVIHRRPPPCPLLLPSPGPMMGEMGGAEPTDRAGLRSGVVGPTVRAFAAALSRQVRELRETLAPLLQRAAGGRGGDGLTGAPTLLELRAAIRSVGLRSRSLHALALAALPPPPATGGSRSLTPSAAASRCLTALYRATAAHQAAPCALDAAGRGGGVGGDGFVSGLRLLCAAAQPYMAALHRWLETGELSGDPTGELFVAAGPAAAAPVGTEAHWEEGFVLRRTGGGGRRRRWSAPRFSPGALKISSRQASPCNSSGTPRGGKGELTGRRSTRTPTNLEGHARGVIWGGDEEAGGVAEAKRTRERRERQPFPRCCATSASTSAKPCAPPSKPPRPGPTPQRANPTTRARRRLR